MSVCAYVRVYVYVYVNVYVYVHIMSNRCGRIFNENGARLNLKESIVITKHYIIDAGSKSDLHDYRL